MTFNSVIEAFTSGDSQWYQILMLTISMTFISTTISALLGIPSGILLATKNFFGGKIIKRLMRTCMSLPPVVAGLLVFILLSRQGPLGSMQLLFSLPAMIIAQCILIIPIMASLTCSAIESKQYSIRQTMLTLGQPKWKIYFLLINESRQALITVVLTGFGRAISEVGAVMMVGGNIAGKTRVLTTAIMLETNKGNFGAAIALGLILMIIALVVNVFADRFQEDTNG